MNSSSLLIGLALAAVGASENAKAAQATLNPHAVVPPLAAATAPAPAAPQRLAENNDTPPPPATPHPKTADGIIEDAGTGSTKAYGRAGVANNFTSIQLSPTAGWFIIDNFQLSAILGLNYIHQTFENPVGGGTTSDHKTIFKLLIEPSYHLPFSSTIWGFIGIGLGLASVPRGAGSTNTGFDFAPRIGANFLVGRSGLFTPAFFMDYTTGETLQTSGGTILGVNAIYGLQAGYTVMW
jgi:hypothetical protein